MLCRYNPCMYPWCEICERPIKDEWWLQSKFSNKRHVGCDLAYRKGMQSTLSHRSAMAPADDAGDPTKAAEER